MLIWTLAIVIFISLGVVGFYQGAVRVGFSLIGLILAFALAMPLSGIFKAILSAVGVEHPVLLAFLAPFTAYLVILIIFKASGLAVHRQIDTYYKYKASDTVRLLFNRMNSRIGIALGMANAFVYVVLLGVVIYSLGYFTLQVSAGDKDGFFLRTFNRLARDLESSKLTEAVAGFMPKSEKYYDGADVLGAIFQNPGLQNRLSTYPVFLTLNEKPEFKALGENTAFQEMWIKNPTLAEFRGHELVKPIADSRQWYVDFDTMLGGDFKDLKTYLETGKSPKYDDERILGRWEFDGAQSFALALRRKSNMTLQERRRLRLAYATVFRDAMLTATPDKKVVVKLPGMPNVRGGATGTWDSKSTGGYRLSLTEGDRTLELDALVENNRLTFTKDGFGLVFEK